MHLERVMVILMGRERSVTNVRRTSLTVVRLASVSSTLAGPSDNGADSQQLDTPFSGRVTPLMRFAAGWISLDAEMDAVRARS